MTPVDDTAPTWPAHERQTRSWRQAHRGGTRDDRTLSEVTVSLPPMIADRNLSIDSPLAANVESAMREISMLDEAHGAELEALNVLLLRTESVASSKIEAVEASLDDYARALHGIRSNPSAVSMVAATDALDVMIRDVDRDGRIELASVTAAHRALMRDDPHEGAYAGRLRDMQNWIGGSDHSPRGALYVPPPPETVGTYLEDLLAYANRDDLPALVQAAIVHAQFESIHPFTDCNGRIGRALINTVLRRRGATTRVVVPLASALVAHRERYFSLLGGYRRGNVRPLIASFADGARVAAGESSITAERLREIPSMWRAMVGPVRVGSAAMRMLSLLPSQPIVSSDNAGALVGASRSSMFAAIDRLRGAGVLRPLTDRQRNQLWGASLILDELDDLGVRVARASR
jgi:Fic family protein